MIFVWLEPPDSKKLITAYSVTWRAFNLNYESIQIAVLVSIQLELLVRVFRLH